MHLFVLSYKCALGLGT